MYILQVQLTHAALFILPPYLIIFIYGIGVNNSWEKVKKKLHHLSGPYHWPIGGALTVVVVEATEFDPEIFIRHGNNYAIAFPNKSLFTFYT